MERLLQELTQSGALDATGAQWALRRQAERGGSIDSVLLDLDLVHEADLLRALAACAEIPAASPSDLARIDAGVAKRLPQSFSRSFRMCPAWLVGAELVALVENPLPPEWIQELRDLFGLEVVQRVAPVHYLALARERVYATPLDPAARELEARLARRRGAPDVGRVVSQVAGARSLAVALAETLRFAARLVDSACFLVVRPEELQWLELRQDRLEGSTVALPEPGCALGPAILHGGYFLGPVAGTSADARFFAALGRPVPQMAFVAPVPAPGGARVVLCADNGPRGMAPRWLAELTLVVARVGQSGVEWKRALHEAPVHALAAAEPIGPSAADHVPVAAAPVAPAMSAEEQAVLARLREAAAAAGQPLAAFVDALLEARRAEPSPPPVPDAAAAVAAEVRGLFERLATDIPTQLARGMESAFRDLVPRLAAAPPAAPPSPAVAAGVDLVLKPAAPKEVASYQSRRAKTARIKL